jgi:hypothetical protein
LQTNKKHVRIIVQYPVWQSVSPISGCRFPKTIPDGTNIAVNTFDEITFAG